MFRNLRLYRLSKAIMDAPIALAEQLSAGAFRPCGSSDATSSGWAPPHAVDSLIYTQGRQILLCFQTEEKILPASYIARVVKDATDAIEEHQGFKPGRKQIAEIRESVIASLIPKAFTRMKRTLVWIDNENGWLCIEGNASRCDDVVAHMIKTISHLPKISFTRTKSSPASCMAEWLCAGEAPDPFSIDQDCELKAHTKSLGTVRYTRQPLDTADVRNHIDSGKLPTRMAMTSEDRISFVLTDNLEIKRISILDVLKEHASAEAKDAEELFASNFALYTGELSRLIEHVVEACGGEKPDTEE